MEEERVPGVRAGLYERVLWRMGERCGSVPKKVDAPVHQSAWLAGSGARVDEDLRESLREELESPAGSVAHILARPRPPNPRRRC
mgnify:CR=1 FL=1